MDELESQIAKIQLGSSKHANSYVFLTAEKVSSKGMELYVIAELPLLNPAAEESCEKICLAVNSVLKRIYNKPLNGNDFENAIAQINEELGKLAGLGQTHWINKLNCIIAVKDGKNLTLATCGKVAAYLLRNGELTDISCSNDSSHPLKTFENYTSGKIRLDDLLILSTIQLFNYVSLDRLKTILTGMDFLQATRTVIEILKENAGPEVAFGALFNLQVAAGQTADEEIDLENYTVERRAGGPGLWPKLWNYAKAIFSAQDVKRAPKVDLPKVPFAQRLKNFGSGAKNIAARSKGLWRILGRSVLAGKNTLDPRRFKEFSPLKKFFLISAAVLLLAVVVNVTIAVQLRKTRTTRQQITNQLKEAQTLVSKAQSAWLYNDQASTAGYLTDAKTKLSINAKLDASSQELYSQTAAQLQDLEQKIEKNAEVKVADLGGIGQADNLIKLPGFMAIKTGGQIVSFSKTSGKMEDGTLKSSDDILASVFTGQTTTAVHNGRGLVLWDYTTGQTGTPFFSNVPDKDNLAGLAYYPTNNRVYALDKKAGQITSFLINNGTFSKPVTAVKNSDLSKALDLAIDGNIYVLTSSGINKYQAGKPVSFQMPFLPAPFSGAGKIYTDKDAKNLYVLDTANNRVLIIDKRGNLIATLKSDKFTKLKDFQVDEKTKTIYLLNDASLLKATY